MNERYWIAINGGSCALTMMPLEHPIVSPKPEQLLGFPTLAEAQKAQEICLTAPLAVVKSFLMNLQAKVDSGEVKAITMYHPEPPTPGPTIWMEAKDYSENLAQALLKTKAKHPDGTLAVEDSPKGNGYVIAVRFPKMLPLTDTTLEF